MIRFRDVRFYSLPFMMNFGWGVLMLASPLYMRDLGASEGFVGYIVGYGALCYAVSCMASGRLADRFGGRPVAAAGTLLMVISLTGQGLSTSLPSYFVFNSISLLAVGCFWPPAFHWLGKRRSDRPLFRRMQIFCVSLSAGRAFGPAVAGFICEINPQFCFLAAAGISFIVFLTMLSLPTPPKFDGVKLEPFDPHIDEAKKTLFLRLAWAGVFLAMFCMVAFGSFFPKLAEAELGMSDARVGYVLSAGQWFLVAGLFWLGRHNNWHYRLDFLAASHVVLAAGLGLIFFFRTELGAYVAYAAINVQFAMVYFSSLYYSLARRSGQGKASGMHETLIGSGALFGPLLSGIATERYGLMAPYAVCLFCQAGVVLAHVALVLGRRRRG